MPLLGWLDSRAAKAPPWMLRGAEGGLLRAVAVTLDAVAETARQAVKLRMPTRSSPDGQVAIGQERLEVRATAFVYEDDNQFGERLRTSWSRRVFSGTKQGLATIVGVLGFTDISVYDLGEWFSSKKWHAWVYVRQPIPWGPARRFGDSTLWGGGATFGSSATPKQARNVREVTASWIPPNTRVYLVFKTAPGVVFGEGLEFGDPGLVFADPGLCRWRLGKETLS